MRAWLEDLGHVCPLAVGEDFPKIDVIVLADDLREEAIAFGRIYKTPVMAWEDAMCWVAHHDRFLDGPLAGKPVPSGVMPHWRRFEYLMPPRSRGISLGDAPDLPSPSDHLNIIVYRPTQMGYAVPCLWHPTSALNGRDMLYVERWRDWRSEGSLTCLAG
jgi:hypothetical protein